MSTVTAVIAGCAVVTAAIKASGPIASGGREIPLWAASVIGLLAPALLAALVVTSTLADGKAIGIGPDTAGVLVGGTLAFTGRSIVLCVIVAAAVTAALRAAGV